MREDFPLYLKILMPKKNNETTAPRTLEQDIKPFVCFFENNEEHTPINPFRINASDRHIQRRFKIPSYPRLYEYVTILGKDYRVVRVVHTFSRMRGQTINIYLDSLED